MRTDDHVGRARNALQQTELIADPVVLDPEAVRFEAPREPAPLVHVGLARRLPVDTTRGRGAETAHRGEVPDERLVGLGR